MLIKRILPLSITLFLVTVFFPVSSFAVHKGAGGLVCGQCHTMHNSQGRMNLQHGNNRSADPAMLLLRANVGSRSQVHRLCLQCHGENGSLADIAQSPQGVEAPKVYSSANWNFELGFGEIGAGGNFYPELDSAWDVTTPPYLGYGHSLGAQNVTPPGGDKVIAEFSCTNCHDPHGTDDPNDDKINIFRNLKVTPLGRGDGLSTFPIPGQNNPGVKLPTSSNKAWKKHWSWVGGVNGTYFGSQDAGAPGETDPVGNRIWPVFTGSLDGNPVSDAGKTNVYGGGRDSGDSEATMSKWCAQCHDNWHEVWEPTNKKHQGTGGLGPGQRYANNLDARRHPVNSTVPRNSSKTCAGSCHHGLLDRVNYNVSIITQGKGLPVTAWDGGSGSLVYYLPWQQPAPGVDSNTPEMDGMADGEGHRVFCLTCHFAHGGPNRDNLRWDYIEKDDPDFGPGSQRGNPIETNVGCQLCHNR